MKIFNELNKRGINYCHWKSNEHLDASFKGITDFDLLFEDSYIAGKILTENGFVKLISPVWKIYPFIEDWVGYEGGIMSHFHVHYKLLTGKKNVKELILPWKDICLENIFKDKRDIKIVSPAIELIMLLTRITIKFSYIKFVFKKNNIINHDDRREIKYLQQYVKDEDLHYWVMKMFDDNNVSQNLRLFNNNLDIRSLLLLKKSISGFYIKNRRFNCFKTNVIYFKNFAIVKIIKFLSKMNFVYSVNKIPNNKNGLIVAFIGCDGSGKSTCIKLIHKWLNWKIKTHTTYLGNLPLINKIKNIRKNKGTSVSKNGYIRNTLMNLRTIINTFGRYFKLNRANRLKNKGFVVVTDRYPQNQQFGYGDGPKIKKLSKFDFSNFLLSRIELFLYERMNKIKPDLVFKLHVDYDTVLKRKPDHFDVNIKEKISLIKNLVFENSVVINIDTTTNDIDNVCSTIKEEIWKKLK